MPDEPQPEESAEEISDLFQYLSVADAMGIVRVLEVAPGTVERIMQMYEAGHKAIPIELSTGDRMIYFDTIATIHEMSAQSYRLFSQQRDAAVTERETKAEEKLRDLMAGSGRIAVPGRRR